MRRVNWTGDSISCSSPSIPATQIDSRSDPLNNNYNRLIPLRTQNAWELCVNRSKKQNKTSVTHSLTKRRETGGQTNGESSPTVTLEYLLTLLRHFNTHPPTADRRLSRDATNNLRKYLFA